MNGKFLRNKNKNTLIKMVVEEKVATRESVYREIEIGYKGDSGYKEGDSGYRQIERRWL